MAATAFGPAWVWAAAVLALAVVAEAGKPAFDELIVKFEPSFLATFGQGEELRIGRDGRCWYRALDRAARANVPARAGGVFDHRLNAERIGRLNKLLEDTGWLTAPGADGPAPGTDAGTVRLTLKRGGREVSVTCRGLRPEPYAALLRELEGLAIQERRVYLHDFVSGAEGTRAWQEVGQELEALRGGPFAKPAFPIEHARYLPIARRIVRGFYDQRDDELIPAVRLFGHMKDKTEIVSLQKMANDRSGALRREVAWALGRIHDPGSLAVLEGMMAAPGTRWDVGRELIRWGEPAVPAIVRLIGLSTKDKIDPEQRTTGEDMIRAYLEHRGEVARPVDPRVVAAVRQALEAKDPADGTVRTVYHAEFLREFAAEGGKK